MPTPSFTQVSYRVRNDNGNEAAATWRQAINTVDTIRVNTNFRVRFRIDEGNSSAWTGIVWNLYYQKNGAGGYLAVTASTPVKFSLSSNYADGADCTTQLSGGSGSFVTDNNGMKETTGGVTNSGSKNYLFETEWCLQLDSSLMGQNDYVDLQIYNGSSPITGYTNTPRITANVLVALTGKDVTSGTPSIQKPTAAAKNNLVGKNVSLSVPTLQKSTIKQVQVLTGKIVSLAAPALEKPTLTENSTVDDLVSKDVALSIPTLQKPNITQVQKLAGEDTSVIAVIGKSSIAQLQKLVGKNFSTTLVVEKSIVSQAQKLVGKTVTLLTFAITKSTITQIHKLMGKSISASTPSIQKSTLEQVQVLISKDAVIGIPGIDKPILSENATDVDYLIGKNLILETPILTKSVLQQLQMLSSKTVAFSSFIIEKPDLVENNTSGGSDFPGGGEGNDSPGEDILTSKDITLLAMVIGKPVLNLLTAEIFIYTAVKRKTYNAGSRQTFKSVKKKDYGD